MLTPIKAINKMISGATVESNEGHRYRMTISGLKWLHPQRGWEKDEILFNRFFELEFKEIKENKDANRDKH